MAPWEEYWDHSIPCCTSLQHLQCDYSVKIAHIYYLHDVIIVQVAITWEMSVEVPSSIPVRDRWSLLMGPVLVVCCIKFSCCLCWHTSGWNEISVHLLIAPEWEGGGMKDYFLLPQIQKSNFPSQAKKESCFAFDWRIIWQTDRIWEKKKTSGKVAQTFVEQGQIR